MLAYFGLYNLCGVFCFGYVCNLKRDKMGNAEEGAREASRGGKENLLKRII